MPPAAGEELLALKGEALTKLDRLEQFLKQLVYRFLEEQDARRTWGFLAKRVEGAREILLHLGDRLVGVKRVAEGFIAVYASSKLGPKPIERKVKVRTLDGRIVEVKHGVPIEEALHYVEVGPYALKCTCPDAVYTASKADRRLAELKFPPSAYRSVLCKHVIALLAWLWARGELDPTKPPYDELLLRGIITAYLASLPKNRKPRVSLIALVHSRSETSNPVLVN